MSHDDDLDYLQRRAEKELEMAQRSVAPEVTAAHYKLAEAYLERVEVLRASAAAEPDGPRGEAAAGLPEGREAESGQRTER